ncbi:MAG: HD domain-containing protein [Candidatus Paceibacterota bacterium]
MPSLQKHMLRVAAVASFICDHWQGDQLDKKSIITACLLHDMGNIIKFHFNLPENELNPNIERWRMVRQEFIKKYGTDEHHASLDIAKELGQLEVVCAYIDGVGHNKFGDQLSINDMGIKIVNYADARVAPHGVVSYKNRMDDVVVRYRSHPQFIGEKAHEIMVTHGYQVETQIFQFLNITPDDITDNVIQPIIEELKQYQIKCVL